VATAQVEASATPVPTKVVAPALPYICKWNRELRTHLFDVLGEYKQSCKHPGCLACLMILVSTLTLSLSLSLTSMDVVDLAAQWVDAENEYREKYLSALDRKTLEASQVRAVAHMLSECA
jgi:hypothetical protein